MLGSTHLKKINFISLILLIFDWQKYKGGPNFRSLPSI